MTHNDAIELMLDELDRACAKFPDWPVDPVHAAAILSEESGELVQAALNFSYSNCGLDRIRDEAIQCGAMAIRVLKGLERYERRQGY